MRFVLCFTYVNEIFARREFRCEKMRFAFCTVFYNSKCDRKILKTQSSHQKRKRVETLAPVHQSSVSHPKGKQFESKNYQISWDIHAKLTFQKSKCWETTMPVHQIVRRDMHRAFDLRLLWHLVGPSIGGCSAGRTHRWEDSELGRRIVGRTQSWEDARCGGQRVGMT